MAQDNKISLDIIELGWILLVMDFQAVDAYSKSDHISLVYKAQGPSPAEEEENNSDPKYL